MPLPSAALRAALFLDNGVPRGMFPPVRFSDAPDAG